jgi:hypothetical protein
MTLFLAGLLYLRALRWKDVCARLPNSTLPTGLYAAEEEPRAINAGTVMGSVAAMRTTYKALANEMVKPERDASETDQGN